MSRGAVAYLDEDGLGAGGDPYVQQLYRSGTYRYKAEQGFGLHVSL